MESHASSPLVGGLQAQAGGGRRLQISNYFFAIFTFGKKKRKLLTLNQPTACFRRGSLNPKLSANLVPKPKEAAFGPFLTLADRGGGQFLCVFVV